MKLWQIGMAAAFTVLAAAGCKKKIDEHKLENAIRDDFSKQVGVPFDSVDCPKNEKVKKGDVFNCTIKMAGSSVPVEVTQTSNDGDVHMRLIATVVTKSIQDVVQQKVAGATVDCGGPLHTAKEGESYQCTLTAGKESDKIKIVATDGYGSFRVDSASAPPPSPPPVAPAPTPTPTPAG